jgi:Cdc6-like AAA superfamily ATPase
VVELVHICFSDEPKRQHLQQELSFQCRYFLSRESCSLQSVTGENFVSRGLEYSEYKSFYSSYFKSSSSGDRTSVLLHDAISKLHISFIPEHMPCRTVEKNAIQTSIRNYIRIANTSKPIYISGMPGKYIIMAYFHLICFDCNISSMLGTGKTATVLSVMAALRKECIDGSGLPEFNFIEINCLKLQSPNDACKLNLFY